MREPLDAEQEVRRVHPNAFHYRNTRKHYIVMSKPLGITLGTGKLVGGAWLDAQSKLPKPSDVPSAEEFENLTWSRVCKSDWEKLLYFTRGVVEQHKTLLHTIDNTATGHEYLDAEGLISAFIKEQIRLHDELTTLQSKYEALLEEKEGE